MGAVSFGRITMVLIAGLDLLLVGLVALTVATGAQAGRSPWLMACLGGVFLAVYVVGRVLTGAGNASVDAPRARWWPNGLWVIVLIGLWAWLMATSPAGLWVAFPLMLIELHALGPRPGVLAVLATTALAIGHGLFTVASPTVGTVLGPLIGAAVAIAVLLGLEAFARETEQRQILLDELTEARGWLAEAERERAVLGERERLARDIHDTLAQGFSAIDLLLRAAAPQVAPGPATDLIARAADTARANLTEARSVVRDLTPADLAHTTLTSALERIARRAAGQGGPAVAVSVVGTPRALPIAFEAAVLRITQSALANVVQHARATRADVTLGYGEHDVRLDIVDDGAGFDPGSPPHSAGGFGLRGIRSRVADLGGRVELTSTAAGTSLAVTLPCPEEDR